MKAYRANGNGSDEIEIPDEYKEVPPLLTKKMVEVAVEADDDLHDALSRWRNHQ